MLVCDQGPHCDVLIKKMGSWETEGNYFRLIDQYGCSFPPFPFRILLRHILGCWMALKQKRNRLPITALHRCGFQALHDWTPHLSAFRRSPIFNAEVLSLDVHR